MTRVLALLAVCALVACLLLLLSGFWRPSDAAQTAQDGRNRVELNDVAAAQPSGGVGTVLLGGFATYFDTCPDCAAAGPALREALGPGWRGERVTVVSGKRSTTVRLTDWCQCRDRHGIPTLVDLSRESFRELAPLSDGVVRVSIEIAGPRDPADDRMRVEDGGPLPATDVAP